MKKIIKEGISLEASSRQTIRSKRLLKESLPISMSVVMQQCVNFQKNSTNGHPKVFG